MSASSKKKLRNDQPDGKLTERQLAEQKQAKEVKFYTIGFVAVVAVLLVVAILVGGQRMIANSGVREKKTVAYTVGDHELNTVDMSYFFVDTVNNFRNQYGPYAAMMGLDTTKPLDQQYVDEEKTRTWADDFMNSARDSAKSVYTLADTARAEGHTLTEDEQKQVEAAFANLELYAQLSGTNVKGYLKAAYGPGASEESYRSYLENSILADSYRAAYAESLTFDDAALREAEKENYNAYSSFDYNQYYVAADRFLTGGTEAGDGTRTYSQEEKDAAAKAAEEAANTLAEARTPDELDKAVAALEINKDTEAASTAYTHNDYRNLPAETAQWLADPARKAGDTTVQPSTSVTTGEDGKDVTTVFGYTVLMFGGVDENKEMLPNVRHILVGYEGGTVDEQGQTVYTDEEKAAAKEKAEALLKTYTEGEKTEDAFAALATENTTDPGSKDNGGLYENVYPGQMVPSFNDWCFAEGRKAGDTGIVESDFGYHVMYFCGDGSLSYRDLQLTNELTTKAMQEWYQNLIDSASATDGDTSRIRTGVILDQG